jgi:carboxypeptidase C (cathepsin A)
MEHSEYLENDFYITGESYAGHYIPAFASRVHQGNKNNEGLHINLKVSHKSNLSHYHKIVSLG